MFYFADYTIFNQRSIQRTFQIAFAAAPCFYVVKKLLVLVIETVSDENFVAVAQVGAGNADGVYAVLYVEQLAGPIIAVGPNWHVRYPGVVLR